MYIIKLILIVLFFSNSFGIEKENSLKIQTHLKEAKVTIDLMTPAIFSVQLIDLLKELQKQNILIRIISDRTFEESPENLIFDSSKHLPIKIIDSKFRIPHNIVIIDKKKIVLGGAYLPSNHPFIDHVVSVHDQHQVTKIYKSFQNTWQQIESANSQESLLRFQHYIDLNSRETKTESVDALESNFVASKNGKKYYRSTSKSANRIAKKNRIYFQSEEDAKESGRSRARNF